MSGERRIVLIVSGGIAAYKSLELIRRLRERGVAVRCVLTKGGSQFVTPLSLSALTEDKVYQDIFSLTDESEMGHIQLSRQADLIVVAPASADILAKMANGHADDLATTVLLATDKPVMVAPAMNVRMWDHPATQANLTLLKQRGVAVIGPAEGPMACGEFGEGRLAEPMDIATAILDQLNSGTVPKQGPLAGRSALVTSGPTHEPIDPVRYIANRSSGKQGHAIAMALAALGARVTLVSGPTRLPDPDGVETIHVERAEEMMQACRDSLPVDVAVFAAAVADWRVISTPAAKIKKQDGAPPPALELAENPDILKTVSGLATDRPALVVGFAAETGDAVEKAVAKRKRKGCDWIVANDVSDGTGTFGGDENAVHLITDAGADAWPRSTKQDVARMLAQRIATYFESESD
ncbi:bifunctional phosphopantothenoylcysteine decarboxylase/phosphopantothenate--cysteine ligase CoaBC [Rhodospirillaceae bacterium KN72]|uniref:Coenzyme A biosynthesis bifunctional protein CoaBC n=1 Tax=Pacificispira spongiicola TaxID=2729598 RepID=A0A7Y0E0A0_9PROT|nr:bifunctional phosphopantothenoylcysteine decarboxylase/phosphopantothenate--cysteine ligase CoaBC [Pacificispira spongiicola]NMM44878.1 bifunctional phosphopantothenoylcysteine decarboxylase/phosphopantothenate--cysteine ligase CoaBC [Pacificispira spongiicola]